MTQQTTRVALLSYFMAYATCHEQYGSVIDFAAHTQRTIATKTKAVEYSAKNGMLLYMERVARAAL